MKRGITAIPFIILLTACVSVKNVENTQNSNIEQGNQVSSEDVYRLDDAIKYLGKHIENEIRQGSSIAIIDFELSSDNFSNYVINELTNIFTKNFVVTEQKRLDLVRQNEKNQLSGYVSDETMVRIGHNIGAQYIISGYLTDLGTSYRFGIYAINIEKATRVASTSIYLSAYDEQVDFLINGRNRRPSEKAISPALTYASSQASFLQSISEKAGNSISSMIPRNSMVAILLPSRNFIAGDYLKNEIKYILDNTNRFNVLPFSFVDSILPQYSNARHRIISGYNEFDLIGIAQKLKANYLFDIAILETKINLSSHDIIEYTTLNITIRVVYINPNASKEIENIDFNKDIKEIGTIRAIWKWPKGEVEIYER